MNLGREDEFQEFKDSLGQLDKGLKSIVAMLNRHNATIVYFGVDDNENVVGLQTGRDTLMDIQLNGMKMSKWTLIFYSKGSNINISQLILTINL